MTKDEFIHRCKELEYDYYHGEITDFNFIVQIQLALNKIEEGKKDVNTA